MNCNKCGTKLEVGAVFCPNCGEKVLETATNLNMDAAGEGFSAMPNQPNGTAPTDAKKGPMGLPKQQLIIVIACVAVAVVLLLVLLGKVFGGNSAKGVVKDYYRALEKCSASKLLDTVPKDYLEELMDDEDLSKRELKDEVQDYLDDYYGDYKDIKVTFDGKEKLDADDLSDYLDEEEDDLSVKKGIQYDLKVRSESKDGDVDTEDTTFIVFRYESSWYSMDAMFLVGMALYL